MSDNDPASRPSDNAFQKDMPGTVARSLAEATIKQLRAKGGLFVEAVRATRMPMAVCDPSLPGNPVVFANDAFLTLAGYSMAEVLGQQPHFMNGADTDPDDARRFREALEQDRDETIETIQYRKDRSRFVASVFISAFRDEGGHTLFHFLSFLDVTARVTAENELLTRSNLLANLRESETRYRTLFENMAQGYALAEIVRDETGAAQDIRMLELNPAFEQLMGISAHRARGRRVYELFPGMDRWWLETLDRIARNGQPERVERRSDPTGPWYEARVYPRGAGRCEVLFEDISERKQADAALRASEERYRLILESATDYAIFTTDCEGVIDSWPAGAQAVFGWTAEEAIGQPIDMTFTPEDRAINQPERERELARYGGRAPNVRWHMRKDGSRVFIDGAAVPLRAGGDVTGFLKVGQDTTERRALEERQQVLVAELQHRTRNLLGVVRAISESTIRSSVDLGDFRERLRARLLALSRVQGLLSRLSENDRVTFDELIRTELAAIHGDLQRITLNGPNDVRLRSSTLQTLAMAIHELATNAVKYGALSQPQARLSVMWSLETVNPGEPPWLHIDWRENGVDMVAQDPATRRRGQGTELIEKALPYQLGARTTYVMGADGVRCTITIPVSRTKPEVGDG